MAIPAAPPASSTGCTTSPSMGAAMSIRRKSTPESACRNGRLAWRRRDNGAEARMRSLVFAVLALLFAAAPAWAWEEYVYADKGFAIQFPVRPKVAAGTY